VNKTAGSVRGQRPRSDYALARALVSLTLEKRFDAITVQQVLDRAAVGRTTFYSRYRGKDDLLVKSFRHMLALFDCRLDGAGDGRVAPVREVFAHVREFRGFHTSLGRSGKLDEVYQAGVEQLTITIGARVPAEAALLARAYAGALMALLRWWLETAARQTPDEMDALFHEMVQVRV
jgi:AcrR family transcriptional regulator